jgi:serine/threonine protein kinase
MTIFGAVFLDYPVIQPLTDYIWLGAHSLDDRKLLRIARVFLALRRGLKSLDAFYRQLKTPFPPTPYADLQRFFPYKSSYSGEDGKEVHFQYVVKLEEESLTKAIFLAKTVDNGTPIVVKFAQHYNFEAHRLLADQNLAPPLLYPRRSTSNDERNRRYGGLLFVVMGFVDGITVFDAKHNGNGVVPEQVLRDITTGIKMLHEDNLVFGDLRPPNVMVEAATGRGLLIDFDWCAVEEEGRYPVSLNDSEDMDWHPDVKRGGVMRREHDLFMLKAFKSFVAFINQ